MNTTSDDTRLTILRQAYGLFKPKSRIGPACWPHHDILWVHSGALRLRTEESAWQALVAPSGLWIPPDTRFDGIAGARPVRASITHFQMSRDDTLKLPLMPDPAVRYRLQAMIELSQSYAREGVSGDLRGHLLTAILDAFGHTPEAQAHADPVDSAWLKAEARLSEMRGIGDVAALIGLSESAFRARHSKRHANSAGQHLIELRMAAAEHALATTNLTVRAIARDVGYGHPESFFHAFRRHTGRTPSEYRRASSPFA